jgi:hypothetical protein
MKTWHIGIRILIGWIALLAATVVTGMIIRVPWPNAAETYRWMPIITLLTVGVLGYLAARTNVRGWRLGVALAAIPCVISLANLVEGSVFLGNVGMPWGRAGLHVLVTYVLVAPMWAWIFGRSAVTHESSWDPKSSTGKVWRFAVSDIAYLVLYFTAGMIIFPYVRDFYATQTIPEAGQVVALQLLLRGPIFVGICLLLLRLVGFGRGAGAVAVGITFTLLSGVFPLLAPNPFFPDAVRWVHFGEVTSSNFLFGMIVGWLWGPGREHAVLLPKHA